MNVEHSLFLSRFADSPQSHEQDGEMLRATIRLRTASGDPAMAFGPRVTGPPLESGMYRQHGAAGVTRRME
jgi:hypothetical protein